MIYLSGVHNAKLAKTGETVSLGVILTPNVGYRPGTGGMYRWWAADNGCFTQGAAFKMERFLAWLDRQPREGCLFVVAPDVPFDAEATVQRFAGASRAIRALGFPVALAAQNGLENMVIPWDDLDAIFIGGDTEWKLSNAAARICWEATHRGKWVHMGRVNSRKRMERAVGMGCDSVDGTFLKWPDANLPRLVSWFNDLCGQTEVLDRVSV